MAAPEKSSAKINASPGWVPKPDLAIDFYIRFLDDPQTWVKFTNADRLNAPKDVSDWGYIFELPYRWWGKPEYLAHMQKRPYGFGVERCYTLDFATLQFVAATGELR